MIKKFLLCFSVVSCMFFCLAAQVQQVHNPIIFADVPDMSIIRVNTTYYMSSTTMHMSPGVPVMKSNDLVNWKLVNYAYDTLADIDELNLANGKSIYGRGSWASSFRYHNGIYYVSTFAQTTGKTYIYSTKNIEKGPWKRASFAPSFHDHSLFFDDDGKVYLLYGAGKLRLIELNEDVSGVKPGGIDQVVVENASAPAGTNINLGAEGSQLYKINGKYYLFNITWPRGGMRTVVIHRADKITGPYEGRLGLQDLGVAQGGLIDTPNGDWYAYLFRDFGSVGRIPYLVPVKWEDGWPVLGVDGKVPELLNLPASKGLIPGIVASDEFTRKPGEPVLPLVWQWNHNPDNKLWSLTQRKGYLRLNTGRTDTSFVLARNTLTQRTIGPTCTGTTKVDVSHLEEGDFAGLVLLQRKYGLVGVKINEGSKSIVMVSAESGRAEEMQRIPLSQNTIYFKAECNFTNKKDLANFFYSLDGKSWISIGPELKMSYTLPHFMGYRFGLFNYATKNTGGYADFDFFRIADTIIAQPAASAILRPDLPAAYTISSPDKNIVVTCDINKALYTVSYKGQSVLKDSKLGLTREDDDFSQNLQVVNVSVPAIVKDHYTILTAKKKNIDYTAIRKVIETRIASGKKMNIIFQVSNDGVAFRYEFPGKSTDLKKITAEATSFHFNDGTKAWLQPKTEAQSGFEHSNPSYEAHYMMDIPTGTPSPGSNGWVYPALFNYNDAWILITEAALGRTYCGTALQHNSPDNEYKINFPEPPEVFTNGQATLNPASTLPWKTPWRIIVIGSLNTIVTSTLGTDLALPAKKMDASFIKPGKSSWSWILEKDDSTIFRVQKKYIDFAADMKWQYCLVDANWDATIGYDSVKILSAYAKQKNVGLLLWYNSAGSWNTVKFTPKDKLLTHESRMKEFSRLQAMGIKGIKVDFFAGDGQSMINYYQDILDDAALHHLLVNFHGATLPRGLHRTYPNLVTTEAVFGYEMITFGQQSANAAPSHSVMCAFVRNAFDPMDFTPMNLYKIPRIKRVTTSAFELATSVAFLSGIQHYAETPDGIEHVPEYVKDFLRQLPNNWDDVKYIDGYPGKLYVVARKAGNKWYIAGINGENTTKQLSLDISFLKNRKGRMITAGEDSNTESLFDLKTLTVPVSGKLNITVKGNDGFVAVFN
jgi:alpha-glucosidase